MSGTTISAGALIVNGLHILNLLWGVSPATWLIWNDFQLFVPSRKGSRNPGLVHHSDRGLSKAIEEKGGSNLLVCKLRLSYYWACGRIKHGKRFPNESRTIIPHCKKTSESHRVCGRCLRGRDGVSHNFRNPKRK